MSLAAACGWSVVRSLAIAVLALPVGRLLSRQLIRTRGPTRLLAGTLLLVPFLTPELMVGYAYANFSLTLVRAPLWRELLYALLVLLKVVPIGTMMLYFAGPASLSAEALYCRRLAFRPSDGLWYRWLETADFLVRGPVRSALPAFGVLFLLSFQEFEMASLLQSVSWTVWLFDAQAGGLFLWESLRFAALPVGCEALVILPVLVLVLKAGRLPTLPDRSSPPASTVMRLTLWGYLFAAVIIVFGFPVLSIGRETVGGLGRMWDNLGQTEDLAKAILTGLAFAVAAGVLTTLVSACFFRQYGTGSQVGWRLYAGAILSLPGLPGSLVLCLVVLSVFQLPGLNVFYDTPVPLVLSSTLYLMPRAMLIQLLLLTVYPGEPQHLATLLESSPRLEQRASGHELMWQMRSRGRFWGTMLLCYWVYWDLTATSVLGPVGVTFAPVRLYNLMHYGHNAVLSAMTCLTIATPLLLLILGLPVRRQLRRWMLR